MKYAINTTTMGIKYNLLSYMGCNLLDNKKVTNNSVKGWYIEFILVIDNPIIVIKVAAPQIINLTTSKYCNYLEFRLYIN